jgi:hypothetical protein
MKINYNIALRKPEALSEARAQGISRKTAKDFAVYQIMCTELNIQNKPHPILNMDETGFPLINGPLIIVATKGAKGARGVVRFTSVECGENVSTVACCSANVSLFRPL